MSIAFSMRFNRDRAHGPRSPSRDRARELRVDGTVPERILWKHVRNRRLAGLKFRRQHPIGPYTADFYCPEARLVVEIDGADHENRHAADRVRDRYMRSRGMRVLRFMASEINSNLGGVLQTIADAASERLEDG